VRPGDPRLRAHLATARGPLAGVLSSSVVAAILVIVQAFVLTGLILATLDGERLQPWVLALLAVVAARGLAGLVTDVCAVRAAGRVGASLRRSLLYDVLRPGSSPRSTGEVAALATRGVAAAEPYLTRYLPAMVLAMVLPALAIAVTATQDVLSAVIELATVPLVPVFGALIGLATRDRAEAQWRAMASLSGHFVDVMRGLPTLVAYRRARAQSSTIRRVTEQFRSASLRTLRLAFASSAVLELVATMSVALVAVVVGCRLAAGGLDLRTALVVLLLAPEVYWPWRRVGAEFHAAAEGSATFEAIGAAVGTETEVREAPPVGPLVATGLTVGYPGRRTPVLDGLDLTIPQRGLTLVKGPSGTGKSTLLAALVGLLPSSGTLRVGGVDAQGPGWQAQVSYLPQRPAFVGGSIADNLRLARPEASDVLIWGALRQVGLEQRVKALPGGLAAAVGEDGLLLSAGERARLALARAVVAARPWVFLDEPTAHLDAVTERIIGQTLLELARHSAVVVVSHRDTLLADADHVITLAARAAGDDRPAVAPVQRSTTAAPEAPEVATGSRGFAGAALLSSAASFSGVALTATAGWLIVKAAEHPATLTMLVAIVGVRTFGLARPVLRYAERLLSHDRALRLLADRRVQVYDAVVPLTPGGLGASRGALLASIVDDVESVVDHQLRVRLPVHTWLIVSAAAAAVAAWLLPVAGLVVLGTALLTGVLAWLVAGVGARRAEQAAVRIRAELSAAVVEAVQLAPELVMWQAQDRTAQAVETVGSWLVRARTSAVTALAVARLLVVLGSAGGVLAMVAVTSPALAEGTLSGPFLALLVLTPLALGDVVAPVAEAGALAEATNAAASRLREIEQTPPVVPTGPVTAALPAGHALALHGADLGWGDVAVVEDLNLDLPPGTRLGVVGPSGSGKSTVAAALLRFVDPLAGTVDLDGTALTQLAPDDVRTVVGLVDDDPHVFASTLAANLRLARPGADDAELRAALHSAHLAEWYDDLPDGLDTWLGDGHAQVSGGERARLGLARAVLADPRVLVLDEPTAHLDPPTARAVSADLLDAAKDRTIVWITHSDIGLDRMDRILDLGFRTVDAPAPGIGVRQQVAAQ